MDRAITGVSGNSPLGPADRSRHRRRSPEGAPAPPAPPSRWGRLHDESGVTSVIVLGVVVAALAAAIVLLTMTMTTAMSIDDKAEQIAKTGRGINTSTDAVLQLNETNELASSILDTAQPLEGQLNEIVSLAQRINGLAGSINSTAGDINSTADGINAEAADILATAQSIERGVAQINENLERTIALARAIKGDTGNILLEAIDAHESAACIDAKLGGTGDGHCPDAS